MFEEQIERIRKGIETAFISKHEVSDIMYQPQLVLNNPTEKSKVIATLQRELYRCDSFKFSVAFITDSGIEGLLGTLKDLEQKGIKGKILTSDYLCFTEPKALAKIAQLSNIELKIYRTQSDGAEGFHTKGYIFADEEVYHIIIGSANLTQYALSVNKEWNTKVVTTTEGAYAQTIVGEFDEMWNSPASQSYDACIADYTQEYEAKKKQLQLQRQQASIQNTLSAYVPKLKPNTMQVAFMDSLDNLVKDGKNKALLISATGTGKTYASAFGVQRLRPKRILFIVHREQILKQAMDTYKKVFGNNRNMGILSGNSNNATVKNCDFIFATIQTISKDTTLNSFSKNAFDVVIFDEAHRTGGATYQKVMQYFKPKYLYLGMTATPERSDNFNVYELFDYNIAYEIRLQHALEDRLLCPFHYFGIGDLQVDDESIRTQEFSRLISNERVKHVMEYAKYYGHSGDRVKGLIFCSTVKEAGKLSEAFNKNGWRTLALSGANMQQEREDAIKRLCDDNMPESERLDYILTVDIFNEGVDIPDINQVIMLRPTESPIIFVQQLGRGLRKANNKEYVVVLDFIGNYNNNFMIPVALSGDRTYNKDNMRRYVSEGTSEIPGCSTIHFDAITKERIYKAVDTARLSVTKFLRDKYFELKNKLGKIPALDDFDKFGGIDVSMIINKFGSYHEFLKRYDDTYTISLTEDEEAFLKILSQKYMPGKRIHELLLLNTIVNSDAIKWSDFVNTLEATYNLDNSKSLHDSIFNVLSGNFYTGFAAKLYKDHPFIIENNGIIEKSPVFAKALDKKEFKAIIKEHIEYGICNYKKAFGQLFKHRPFQLYAKYTYEDVCRLLEWPENVVAQNMGGYKYDAHTNTMPVFINYEKEEGIADTINYEDRFVHQRHLIGLSKSNRTVASQDVIRLSNSNKDNVVIDLFVRKNKDDEGSKEFYYLGTMQSNGVTESVKMKSDTGNDVNAVEIHYILDQPVREDIYDYITT
ncbi:DUF3427 domain-containing protein [Veillonella seminalis]|uniref:Helicase C-terminal domain-containing protein n=1 Tax=Veillonella seminalis ACS-216-V-Col6b TaxID=883156 RepID=K9D1M7_9FIRM|nr:DUF3427 domain-containing protein [Veillonella seminalis]EKU78434.1 hypothetical protein HMPREF9282_01051 [Veillonella seminalis ACS-216-V-Col6b]